MASGTTEFEPAEIPVWSEGDSYISLVTLKESAEGLTLDFAFSHSLYPSGEVILPTDLQGEGPAMAAASTTVFDADGPHFEAWEGSLRGSDSFTITLRREVLEDANGSLQFPVENLYHVNYAQKDLIPTSRKYGPVVYFDLYYPSFELRSDGTFLLKTDLGDYTGSGIYQQTTDSLVLKTDDGLHTWIFAVEGDHFLYQRNQSTDAFPDGACFMPSDYADRELIWAIEDAIHDASGSPEDAQCNQSYIILDAELVGEDWTVCLYRAHIEYAEDHGTHVPRDSQVGPLQMTFRAEDGSYTLTSCEEGGHDFTKLAADRLRQNEAAYASKVTSEAKYTPADHDCDPASTDDNVRAALESQPADHRTLVAMGRATLEFAFRSHAAKDEGLNWEALAHACQEIVSATGEPMPANLPTGQGWFSEFRNHARATLAQMGYDRLAEEHPCCMLALEIADPTASHGLWMGPAPAAVPAPTSGP